MGQGYVGVIGVGDVADFAFWLGDTGGFYQKDFVEVFVEAAFYAPVKRTAALKKEGAASGAQAGFFLEFS